MKCFSDRDPGSETGSEAAHLEDLNLLAFSALSRSFSEVCGYERLSGPVEMDSTGTLIQKIGSKRYVMFGSADRKVYIRSYPGWSPRAN
jgi:hypothetical protein